MASTQGKIGKTGKSKKQTESNPSSVSGEKDVTNAVTDTPKQNSAKDAKTKAKNGSAQEQENKQANGQDQEFDFLVGLLTGSQQEEINEIKEKFDDLPLFVERLSDALPEAIMKRGDDKVLVQAFSPVVQKSMDAGDPDEFARRLLPTIRRSIRMIVEETVDKVVTQINYSLEHSLNLRWRMEALTTGRPFSEVVLSHTLKYRVEQILLIHRETGLLLNQANHEDGTSEDGDLISSMLSAIQSFIQDSFKVDSQSQLENVRMGDFELFIEQDKDIVIAAAVRGVPTAELEHVLQDATSYLQLVHEKDLQAFDGDTSVFENSEDTLRACLKSDFEVPSKKPNPILLATLAALALFIIVSLGFNIYRGQQWRGYLDTLKDTPGIMITQEKRRGGSYEIAGLVDTYAKDPMELLESHNINPNNVKATWANYSSNDPILLGNVIFKGYACENWSTLALAVTKMLPGVNQVDTANFEVTNCN